MNDIEKATPIFNFPNYGITENGYIYSRRRERAKGGKLKQQIGPHGYLTVCLWKNKKSHTKLVHRLVLETFVGKCPDGMEACHNNGVRTDNRLSNLRWDTRSNNFHDKIGHGTYQYGEQNPSAKLSKKTVLTIRELFDSNKKTVIELSKKFNIPYGTIYCIVKRLRWKYL